MLHSGSSAHLRDNVLLETYNVGVGWMAVCDRMLEADKIDMCGIAWSLAGKARSVVNGVSSVSSV